MALVCTIKRRSLASPQAVLVLRGSVDSSSSSKLDEVLGLLAEQQYERIVVDLAQVDYVSSAGWLSFLNAVRRPAKHPTKYAVAAMQPTVKAAFDVLGLDRVIEVHESMEAAQRPARAVG
jgi:anti-sigma B factor antagonist